MCSVPNDFTDVEKKWEQLNMFDDFFNTLKHLEDKVAYANEDIKPCRTSVFKNTFAIEDCEDCEDKDTCEIYEQIMADLDPDRDIDIDLYKCPEGYESLFKVLMSALDQAARGKGKKRHADEDIPFEDQDILKICRELGNHGFALGQAKKKINESTRLSIEQSIQELLGAINYIAAGIIYLKEQIDNG